MVKMGKLVQKLENHFSDEFSEKMVKQITLLDFYPIATESIATTLILLQ
jgi:hypothetical protein